MKSVMISKDIIHKFASDLSRIDSRCPIALSYISLLNLTKGKQLDELRSQIFTNIFFFTNSNKNLRFFLLPFNFSVSISTSLSLFSSVRVDIFFLVFLCLLKLFLFGIVFYFIANIDNSKKYEDRKGGEFLWDILEMRPWYARHLIKSNISNLMFNIRIICLQSIQMGSIYPLDKWLGSG